MAGGTSVPSIDPEDEAVLAREGEARQPLVTKQKSQTGKATSASTRLTLEHQSSDIPRGDFWHTSSTIRIIDIEDADLRRLHQESRYRRRRDLDALEVVEWDGAVVEHCRADHIGVTDDDDGVAVM